MNNKKIISIGKFILQSFILATAIFFIHKEIKQYTISQLKHSFENLSTTSIFLIIFVVFLDYLVLSSFDILAFKEEDYHFSKIKSIFTGFISFSLANSVGLSGLTASSTRINLYSYWKVPYKTILKIILFCYLTFWLGILWIGGVFLSFHSIPLDHLNIELPFKNTKFIGIIFLISAFIFSIYIIKNNKNKIHLFFIRIFLALIDWILISLVLFLALPPNDKISFFTFFTIFITGQFIGILSNVPGGIGVFDIVCISFLRPFYSSNIVLGSLLIYRLFYFFIPLIIGLLSFLIFFFKTKKKQIRNL